METTHSFVMNTKEGGFHIYALFMNYVQTLVMSRRQFRSRSKQPVSFWIALGSESFEFPQGASVFR